jgi:Malate/L-lactate dehydrogenase
MVAVPISTYLLRTTTINMRTALFLQKIQFRNRISTCSMRGHLLYSHIRSSINENRIPYQQNCSLLPFCFFGTGTANSKTKEPEVGMVHITIDEATEMTTKALRQIGWDEEDAKIQAEVMVSAELCGNNQGLVKMYQPQLMAPSTNVQKPKITRETAISAVIDSQQAPGMIAAMTASNLVAQKVRSSNLPIAIVCTHNSSTSSGQLAHYVERIAKEHNMIGIAMCNSPEMVAAAPGTKPVFGTNPIAISIPLADSPYPYTVRSTSLLHLHSSCDYFTSSDTCSLFCLPIFIGSLIWQHRP